MGFSAKPTNLSFWIEATFNARVKAGVNVSRSVRERDASPSFFLSGTVQGSPLTPSQPKGITKKVPPKF